VKGPRRPQLGGEIIQTLAVGATEGIDPSLFSTRATSGAHIVPNTVLGRPTFVFVARGEGGSVIERIRWAHTGWKWDAGAGAEAKVNPWPGGNGQPDLEDHSVYAQARNPMVLRFAMGGEQQKVQLGAAGNSPSQFFAAYGSGADGPPFFWTSFFGPFDQAVNWYVPAGGGIEFVEFSTTQIDAEKSLSMRIIWRDLGDVLGAP
jgi:hypothetical protein